MKASPTDGASQRQATWRSFAVPLFAATISALTVWGAILLSLQSQDQSGRMLVQVTEGVTVENIPTADIATVPPLTMIPTWGVTVTPIEASPTLDLLATVSASPAAAGTTLPSPTSTPWPCAGGVPLHWKLYIVQWGDTLFSLARRHGTTMDQVIFYNCLQSVKVRADQRLYLPPLLMTPVPSFTPAPSPTPTPLDPTTAPPPPTTTAPTWTSTPLPLPTFTATATLIPTATATLSPTATATVPPSATPVLTATATSVPTTTPISPTVTLEPTATPTPEPVSPTPEPSDTPVPSSTPEETPTSSPAP